MNNLGCDGYMPVNFQAACGRETRRQKKPADGKTK